MKATKWILAMAAVGTLGVGAALARPEGPPGGGRHLGKFWRRPEVRQQLNLTDDQVRQLDEVFVRNEKALIDLKADVEKRQLDMQNLVADHRAEDKKLEQAIDRLEDARAKLGKARAMMLLDIRRILTPEQRDRLEQIRAERREQRRDQMDGQHGRGGHRGRSGAPAPMTPGTDDDELPPPSR